VSIIVKFIGKSAITWFTAAVTLPSGMLGIAGVVVVAGVVLWLMVLRCCCCAS